MFCGFFISAFFLAVLSTILQSGGNSNTEKNVLQAENISTPTSEDELLISDYSLVELLSLNGHPHIFDNWDEANNFYTGVIDSRIQMTDAQTLSSKQMRQRDRFADEVVLYLVKSSSGKEDQIGYIFMNIFDESLTSEIVLDDVIQIVVDYLPADFLDFYKLDSAYMTNGNGLITYVYACRLTDSSLTESVESGKHYATYYNFRIYNYLDNNCWCAETGYEAYGGHSLDWIEKFAEPWEIDLSQYFEVQ